MVLLTSPAFVLGKPDAGNPPVRFDEGRGGHPPRLLYSFNHGRTTGTSLVVERHRSKSGGEKSSRDLNAER
ncbi:MAG: hypothetical protein ACREP9_03055, partial [Candidatus Dormibacteraceae bacterium]